MCIAFEIFVLGLLFCVSAPAVNLTTDATKDEEIVNVAKGSRVSFYCDYENVTPPGNQSVFSFNGIETILTKVSYVYLFLAVFLYS